jgi:serine/threonine protein kinase/tetratricopeptide (TPR) repeat protein
MPTDTKSARTIFLDALERSAPEVRVRFIDAECGGDEALRAEVVRLLDAHGDLDNFMNRPAAANSPTINLPQSEQPGAMIGRYKLLEQIGEGGMGVVYVAEQTEPVRRRVALKIIKPGMDTRQVIARFEAERQALAMMDHPNIAKVLDAGATDEADRRQASGVRDGLATSSLIPDPCPLTPSSGRPYFVMELVRGLPITDYCDQARLHVSGRLELFMTVCHAVQHAHQKGIIHRDLKPSNVLVTLHDGQPVVKVIDFGVAKAINQSLTERTLYTAFTELIGTPLYMSPEQAELSGLDIDTRSDVYSLGVLLYELLTGQTPFDRDTLVKAGLDEVRRMIREDEPPRPSHRISTLNAQAISTLSQKRGIDQRQLSRTLKGELDWIVMKALEKDRNRRYESASAFAVDIERHLNHEPVAAGPPSAIYRFRKFARRRRGALVAVSFVAVSLLAGVGISLWQAAEANSARELADQRAIDEGFARRRAEANLRRGTEAVEILLSRVAEERLLDEPRLEEVRMALLTDALRINGSFLDENPTDAEAKFEAAKAYRRMADIHGHLGDPHKSADASRQAIRLLESLIDDRRDELRFRQELAKAYRQFSHSRFNGAPGEESPCDVHRKNLSLLEPLNAASPTDPQLLQRVSEACYILGYSLQGSSPEESQGLFRRSLAIGAELVERHPERSDLQEHLARSHWFSGRVSQNSKKYDEAKQKFLSALSAATEALTKSPRSAAIRKTQMEILDSLATVCAHTSDRRALSYARRAQSAAEQLVDDYPLNSGYRRMLFYTHMKIAECLNAVEEFEEARQELVKCVEIAKRLWSDFPEIPEQRSLLGWAHLNLAGVLRVLGELDAALAEYESAVEVYEGMMKKDPAGVRQTVCWLLVRQAMCHDVLGDFQEGTKCYEKAAAVDPNDHWTREVCMRQLFRLADDLWKIDHQGDARRTWAAAIERTRISFDSVPSDQVRFDLGVAHYRVGRFEDSLRLFQESIDFLRSTTPAENREHDGNSGHFYFMALNHASLGHQEKTKEWFERGRQWDQRHSAALKPSDEQSKRAIRKETAEFLGVPDDAEKLETPPTPALGPGLTSEVAAVPGNPSTRPAAHGF